MKADKRKLVALIEESVGCVYGGEYGDEVVENEIDISDSEIERIADYLLANGVVVPCEPDNACLLQPHAYVCGKKRPGAVEPVVSREQLDEAKAFIAKFFTPDSKDQEDVEVEFQNE